MQGKDFANKKFKRLAKRRYKSINFFMLLVFVVCVAGCFKFFVYFGSYVSDVVAPSSPKKWLFVDYMKNGNGFSYPVRGSFGLRWMINANKNKCESVFLRLKKSGLPMMLVKSSGPGVGLCRVDFGPFLNIKDVFEAKRRLYFSGFYGNVKIVSWLN
jgi:hypothetical protein